MLKECISTIERALSSPKRNLMLSALFVAVGLGAILIGNSRSSRLRLERAYAEGVGSAMGLFTQTLTGVFGERGLGAVERGWLGVRVYNPEVNAWIEIDGLDEPIADETNGRVVMLVHGLDEPGGIWDQLTPALVADGHTVVRFEYPNDQLIAKSADELLASLDGLAALGVTRMDLVCHSMGGLVSRDAMTRDRIAKQGFANHGITIERYVTIGTPHGGSPWARMQAVSEMREQVQRWVESDDMDPKRLMGFVNDGTGQAGRDLLPGSEFLVELNARTMPAGVVSTCIVGRATKAQGEGLDSILTNTWLVDLVGGADAGVIQNEIEKLKAELGDGVVPMSSAVLDGVDDVVILMANHRGLIRNVELGQAMRELGGMQPSDAPPGIAVVLDRLKRVDE